MMTQNLTAHWPMVRRIAKTMGAPTRERDDLIAAGLLGLVLAERDYDVDRGEFKTYARYRVRGAMYDYLRSIDPLTNHARRKRRLLDRASHDLTHRLRRPPTSDELATHTGLPAEVVLRHGQQLEPVAAEFVDDAAASAAPTPEAAAIQHERDGIVADALTRLKPRQQQALALFVLDGLTQGAIGGQLGVTESRVCQIVHEAACAVRRRLEAAGYEQQVAP